MEALLLPAAGWGDALMDRREVLGAAIAGVAAALLPRSAAATASFDIAALKPRWRNRLAEIAATGKVPLIDIESSYAPRKFDGRDFARQMDDLGVALSCLSPTVPGGEAKSGSVWTDHVRDLMADDPDRYIPTTVSAMYPVFTETPARFLDETFRHARADGYALLGEFEFRHYPSPLEYKRGEFFRDVDIPLDGEHGHRLFTFSAETGVAFQIHYEIEDRYLPVLEKMLAAYPKAKVIWCHLAQVRYQDRAKSYGVDYVRKLIATYPNLWFDTAFGGFDSRYPGSNERHARVWADRDAVKPEWKALIERHPWRFLAALDLGGDRMDELGGKVKALRRFLGNFDRDVGRIVGHRAAWRLLFDEDVVV